MERFNIPPPGGSSRESFLRPGLQQRRWLIVRRDPINELNHETDLPQCRVHDPRHRRRKQSGYPVVLVFFCPKALVSRGDPAITSTEHPGEKAPGSPPCPAATSPGEKAPGSPNRPTPYWEAAPLCDATTAFPHQGGPAARTHSGNADSSGTQYLFRGRDITCDATRRSPTEGDQPPEPTPTMSAVPGPHIC